MTTTHHFSMKNFSWNIKKRRTCWDVFCILCTWKILESVSQVRAKTGKVAMSAHSTFTDRGGGVWGSGSHFASGIWHRLWNFRDGLNVSQRITADARLYWWNWESLRNWLKRSFWWLRLGRGCWNEKNEKTLARGKRMEEDGREWKRMEENGRGWNRLTFTFDP